MYNVQYTYIYTVNFSLKTGIRVCLLRRDFHSILYSYPKKSISNVLLSNKQFDTELCLKKIHIVSKMLVQIIIRIILTYFNILS